VELAGSAGLSSDFAGAGLSRRPFGCDTIFPGAADITGLSGSPPRSEEAEAGF